MAPKGSKLNNYLNYRMRVTLQDGRNFIGTFKGTNHSYNKMYYSLLSSTFTCQFKFNDFQNIFKNGRFNVTKIGEISL